MPVNEGPLCWSALICLEGENGVLMSDWDLRWRSFKKGDILCWIFSLFLFVFFFFCSFRVKAAKVPAWGTTLYVRVVKWCLFSADCRGLGPQQPQTIWFDERNRCSGPGKIFFFFLYYFLLSLIRRPSGEVYQEWLKQIDWNFNVDFWQCHHSSCFESDWSSPPFWLLSRAQTSR